VSGRWTEIYDSDRDRWVKVYIELPTPISRGSATPGTPKATILYGPDGKRLEKPESPRIGFRP
jgi:hypothetical protein